MQQLISPQLTAIQQLKRQNVSHKVKRQNKFIKRNISKIKSYSFNNNNISSNVINSFSQDEEGVLSGQILTKLFNIYRIIYPSAICNSKQVQILSFQSKQQYKSTLNYHKILQIFSDVGLMNIQVDKKLSLLRIIKKYAFNQQFISLQQWKNIYKSLVNLFNFKQIIFLRLIKEKQSQKKWGQQLQKPKQLNKAQTKEIQYRSRRIKTQTSITKDNYQSLGNLIPSYANESQLSKKTQFIDNRSGIRKLDSLINDSNINLKSYNPNQYRARHKKLLTDMSQVTLKNLRNNIRSEKMIGIDSKKNPQNHIKTPLNQLSNQGDSNYLNRAIKSKKVSKITWESLFSMNEDTMYSNIIIPQFAKHQQ